MLTQQVTAAGGGAFFGKLSVDVSQKVENTFEAIFTQSAQKYEKSEPKLLTKETATAESKVTESVGTDGCPYQGADAAEGEAIARKARCDQLPHLYGSEAESWQSECLAQTWRQR